MGEKTGGAVQEIAPRHCELKFGYQDKETLETFHKSVTFGKRLTGADFISAAENSANSDTQFTVELMAAEITKFGDLEMPTPITVLLSLNRIDREKLVEEHSSFLDDTKPGTAKILEVGKVQIAGIERDGEIFTVIEFGNLLTGYDEIEIEREAKSQWQHNAMRIAKEVSSISTAAGKKLETQLTFDELKSADMSVLLILTEAEEQWLNSFR